MRDGRERWIRQFLPWPRVEVTNLATGEEFAELWSVASKAAGNHPHPSLNKLPYTETEARLHFLHGYCSRGQIRSDAMWRMRREDLEYIAGHTEPTPDYVIRKANETQFDAQKRRKDGPTKLMANAARAKYELERRDRITNTLAVALAGVVAALATVGAVLLADYLAG